MFLRAVISSLAFLLLSLGVTWHYTSVLPPTIDDDYRHFIEERLSLRASKAWDEEPAIQWRTGVQKDLYLPKGSLLLHHQIKAENSILTIREEHNKWKAEEKLSATTCRFEDSLDSFQIFSAKEGTYDYPDQLFRAQEVHLALFRLDKAYLQGAAEAISIFLLDKNPVVKATNLRAKMEGE